MTKQCAFVVGDIHGMYHSLQVILSHWRREDEHLIMVGDYIDRGPQSEQVLYMLRDLKQEEEDVTLLRGNHEQLLINYLKSPSKEWQLYEHNGGATTISQLLGISAEEISRSSPVKIAHQLRQQEPWLMSWLENLVYYRTFGKHIIVHAGVDFTKKDWRHTSLHDLLWIREPFHQGKNTLDRPIIFGHTPVQNLHDSDNPWIRDNKWGIDGGNVFGGSLIALRIDRESVVDQIVLR